MLCQFSTALLARPAVAHACTTTRAAACHGGGSAATNCVASISKALRLLPQGTQIRIGLLHLGKVGLMRRQVGTRVPATRFLSSGAAGGLPRDRGGLGVQGRQSPRDPVLNLVPEMKQMPDIALVPSV